MGQNIANQHNAIFYETSAKLGTNVNEVFQDLALKIYDFSDLIIRKETLNA